MGAHRVFVYGTLKRGFPNHGTLRGAKFLGVDVVEGRLHDFGFYPGLDNTPGLAVHGEVFEVDAEILARLDRLEGIGRNDGTGLYDRRRTVSAETGLPMWTYVATRRTIISMSRGIVENGTWEQPVAEEGESWNDNHPR
jgi:gamma-glutamylcyclotransferase (GGCT)/AIG2-like uncharacterized protein YtfP